MKDAEKNKDLVKHNTSHGYRLAFKYYVLTDFIRGNESETFIARKHGIPSSTLGSFKKELLEKLGYFRILQDMKARQNDLSAKDLAKENEELKKALQMAMMKVEALEILVDIAEDQFNIDIRKKPEPKQSK